MKLFLNFEKKICLFNGDIGVPMAMILDMILPMVRILEMARILPMVRILEMVRILPMVRILVKIFSF